MRILLIDDDETTVRRLIALLTGLSRGSGAFQVWRADGLFEGLRRLDDSAEAFDLVVLDLGLAECGGPIALKLVRAQAPGIPVVVVTTGDGPEVERAVRDAGASGYLARGRLDASALERALGHASARGRSSPPMPARPELSGSFRLIGGG